MTIAKGFHFRYSQGMTRERAITKLVLQPVNVMGQKGWVEARWERADGSGWSIAVKCRSEKAGRWYVAHTFATAPTAERLRDVPVARIETAINATPRVHEWLKKGTLPEIEREERLAIAKRPRLERPASRRLDDAFYARVADAYRGAVANGLPPSKTLAEDSGTPPGTINRWIAEARKPERGYLPPAERGKASA
jgi:hypothetical protein